MYFCCNILAKTLTLCYLYLSLCFVKAPGAPVFLSSFGQNALYF
jgi:hypothetical protein